MRRRLIVPTLRETIRYGSRLPFRSGALPPIAGGAGAPILTAFSTASSGVTKVNSQPSATLIWQTDDVFVVFGTLGGATAGTWSISNTGSGLSWGTAQQVIQDSTSSTGNVAYAATATANSSGIVTLSTTNADVMAIGVYQWRGSGGIGNSAKASGLTTSPQRVSLAMTSVDSAVCWDAADWSASATEAPTPAATSHGVSTPGPSATPVATVNSGADTVYFQNLDDETSTGAILFGVTGTSAGPFTLIAVEVLGAGGAAAVPMTNKNARMRAGRH